MKYDDHDPIFDGIPDITIKELILILILVIGIIIVGVLTII